jgi:hypothetical protein
MLKVLGREFEGEPFFKRVSLNITRKTSVRVSPLSRGAFVLSGWGMQKQQQARGALLLYFLIDKMLCE